MTSYLLFKWLHIVSIISWMAGILYLFRLFIYHVGWGLKSEDNHQMLTVMERRLLFFITHPAMGLSWIAGLGMISIDPLLMKQGWLHTKLLLVVFLTVLTIWAGRLHKQLKNKDAKYTTKTLRFLNELPTLLMLAIVGLVIFKPF